MTDLISRDDAIRALNGACSNWEDDANVQEIVMVLPSAEDTCATCADRALCIMSAPDGNWKACKDYRPSAEAVQLKQTDTLIIADALRYLAQDTERHLSDRTRADALREQILKYGASMCHSAEAVQGEWIRKNYHTYICSQCGYEESIYGNVADYKFCSHCGARMKGGDSE